MGHLGSGRMTRPQGFLLRYINGDGGGWGRGGGGDNQAVGGSPHTFSHATNRQGSQ